MEVVVPNLSALKKINQEIKVVKIIQIKYIK